MSTCASQCRESALRDSPSGGVSTVIRYSLTLISSVAENSCSPVHILSVLCPTGARSFTVVTLRTVGKSTSKVLFESAMILHAGQVRAFTNVLRAFRYTLFFWRRTVYDNRSRSISLVNAVSAAHVTPHDWAFQCLRIVIEMCVHSRRQKRTISTASSKLRRGWAAQDIHRQQTEGRSGQRKTST